MPDEFSGKQGSDQLARSGLALTNTFNVYNQLFGRKGLRPPLFPAGQSPGGPIFVRAGEVDVEPNGEPGWAAGRCFCRAGWWA
jgi:hypothetical protein